MSIASSKKLFLLILGFAFSAQAALNVEQAKPLNLEPHSVCSS